MAPKHIAIVGFGSSCLALIKALQDLPAELRRGWRITVYERREGLGGQWLPDEVPAEEHSMTGLYPNLRTNTPVHMMTYPHSPFPDGTDLFPHWTVVLKYLEDYAKQWGIYDSSPEDWESHANLAGAEEVNLEELPLRFSHTPAEAAQRELPRRILCGRELYSATWQSEEGAEEGAGHWKLKSRPFKRKPPGSTTINGHANGIEEYEDRVDVLVDATGHLVHPSIPQFNGQEEWLQADSKRKIMHSAWYRGPESFKGKRVLIVGAGPSGLDGVLQISKMATKVYHAVSPNVVLPPGWPVERLARLSHFTAEEIILSDAMSLRDIDIVYLGTGFILKYDYLERGGMLQRRPGLPLPPIEDETFPGIVSTDLYVRPLFEHTISFAPAHGPASLFWCGQIMSTSYRFSNAIQSALIAWTLALPSLVLPSRDEMVESLKADEARTRALGRSVERLGHRQGAPHMGESEVYQRRIVRYLESKGITVGESTTKTGVVMEPWREEVRKDFWMCMRGWNRMEKLGRSKELVQRLAVGEQGYAELGRLVIEEQRQFEKDQGRDPLESEISGWD